MAKAVSKSKLVGSLGIEVRPVMDGFRKKLKAGVIAAARGVEAEVETRVDSRGLRGELNRAVRMAEKSVRDAKVGVDLSGFRKAYRKEMEKLRKDFDALPPGLGRVGPYRDLQRRLNETYEVHIEPDRSFFDKTRTLLDGFFERDYRGKVKFELDADTDDGWARLKSKIDRAFLDHGNYKFKVRADVDLENGSVDAALRKLKMEMRRRAFDGQDFEIDVKPNMSDGELRQIGRKLKRFKQKWDDTELEFQLSLDHTARYVAAARLAWLARDRWVKLRPLVDHRYARVAAETLAALTGGRLAQDLGRRLWDMVKNIDKAVPTFGALLSGIAGLAAATVQLLKHTFAVAGSLGHIFQMIGLLGPGFLAAGGILASAFIVPLFKAKDHIQDILDDWTALSDKMGEAFWQTAMKDFRSAHELAFGSFRDGMVTLSAAAGRHFGRVSDAISRIVTPRFSEWIAHASRGLEELGSHSDGFARVIDVLGRYGSRSLEHFLGWLGRTTTKYADWLDEAERTGRLVEMIDRGVQAMKDFGRAVKNAGTTLGGIYEVASKFGGADLGAMADGLGRWSDVTHSSAFQVSLGRWFQGMGEAWAELKRQSSSQMRSFLGYWSRLVAQTGRSMGAAAGKMLSGVLVSFSGDGFNRGFGRFFEGLNDGLDQLTSTWPKVSNMLGDLLSFMGSLGRGFAPVVGVILETAAAIADRLGPTLEGIVETAGPKMARAFEALGGIFVPLLEAAARLVEGLARIPGAVEAVTYAFIGLRAVMGVSSLITAVSGAVKGLGASFATAQGAVGKLLGRGAGSGVGLGAVAGVAGGARAGLAGLTGFLLNPWTAAFAVAGAALLAFSDVHSKKVVAANESLVRSFEDAANGIEGTSVRMRMALEGMLSKDMWGFSRNVGLMLDDVSSLMGQGKVGQWGARLLWDSDAQHAADMMTDNFEKLAQMAERSSVGAASALQELGRAWVDTGAKGESFAEMLASQAERFPALGRGLENLAQYLGYTADASGVLAMVSSDLNLQWAMQQVEIARVAQSTESLNGVLDASTRGFGMTFDAATELVAGIEQLAPAFIDFGNAAVDANGQAVASVGDVVASLEEQVAAQAQWAEDMVMLAERGISQGFLMELSKVPGGAEYIREFAALAGDGSAEAQAQFDSLRDRIAGIDPVLSGMVSSAATNFQELASVTGSSFSQVVEAAELALSQLPTTVDLAGVNTVEQLVSRLSEGGVSVRSEGENLVFEFANGIDDASQVTVGLGEELGNAVVQGLGAIDLAAEAELMVNPFNDTLMNAAPAIGADFQAGIAEGMDFAAPIEAVTTGAQGMVEAGQATLESAGASALGSDWAAGIASGVVGASGEMSSTGEQLGLLLVEGARSGLSGAGEVGLSMGLALVNGVRSGMAGFTIVVGSRVSAAVLVVSAAAPVLRVAGNLWGVSLGTGFTAGSVVVRTALTTLITSLSTAMSSANARFRSAGQGWGSKLSEGIGDRKGTVTASMLGVISAARVAASNGSSGFYVIGLNIGNGLARGIEATAGRVAAAAAATVRNAIAAAKAAGDIHSPSRKTHYLGQMLGLGAQRGIESSTAGVVDASDLLVAAMLASVAAGAGRADRVVEGALVPAFAGVGSRDGLQGGSAGPLVAMVDPASFTGAEFRLRVADEDDFRSYVEGVSSDVVLDYDDARLR